MPSMCLLSTSCSHSSSLLKVLHTHSAAGNDDAPHNAECTVSTCNYSLNAARLNTTTAVHSSGVALTLLDRLHTTTIVHDSGVALTLLDPTVKDSVAPYNLCGKVV
jgi:hypothetical protein